MLALVPEEENKNERMLCGGDTAVSKRKRTKEDEGGTGHGEAHWALSRGPEPKRGALQTPERGGSPGEGARKPGPGAWSTGRVRRSGRLTGQVAWALGLLRRLWVDWARRPPQLLSRR